MKKGTLDLETSHSRLETAIEGQLFRNFVTTLIVINAIILGFLTYEKTLNPGLVSSMDWFDRAVTIIFAIEIALKLAVYRFGFFKSGWNWFDDADKERDEIIALLIDLKKEVAELRAAQGKAAKKA